MMVTNMDGWLMFFHHDCLEIVAHLEWLIELEYENAKIWK
jgi:hypothetical protein